MKQRMRERLESWEQKEECSAVLGIIQVRRVAEILHHHPLLGEAWLSRFESMLADLDDAREEVQG